MQIRILKKLVCIVLLVQGRNVFAADEAKITPGKTSDGEINLKLEVTDNVSAGFLKTTLDQTNSELRNQLSTRLSQVFRDGTSTTLPFCVLSSGGGFFEVTSFDVAGEDNNRLLSQFGGSLPIDISIGDDDSTAAKYRAVRNNCSTETAIPLTIHLQGKLSGKEIGRIYGRFNLLVKSE